MIVTYLRPVSVPGLGGVLYDARQGSLVSEQVFPAGQPPRLVHGVHPVDQVVATVEAGSPAARAGLRPGDLLTSLDGEPIQHWLVVERRLRGRPEHPFAVGWRSPGSAQEQRAEVRQEWRAGTDEYGHRTDRLVFGAAPSFERGRGERVAIDGRLGYAVAKSVERTLEAIGVMASGLGSVLRGQSPSEDLGGPIMMFQVAAVSGSQGWEMLFLMIALVSISVGLINLLPVPVLDGGHLLVFAVEGIRRRPLAPRARARITMCGLAIVGLITVLALRNDVVRYIM